MLKNNTYYTLPKSKYTVLQAKMLDGIWQLVDINRSFSANGCQTVYCLVPKDNELYYVEYTRQRGEISTKGHAKTKWLVSDLIECEIKEVQVLTKNGI